MALTFGFYNSLNGDRKYNADQFGQIFDGIINDGVFMSIGDHLMVSSGGGMVVYVGTGRAWFNSTWTRNDAILPLTLEQSEVLLNRIDAVILEVDTNADVRANSIKILKGTPASEPTKPLMIQENGLYQYPLAYVTVNQGVTSITQAEIENAIGLTETPFVTGILETMDISSLVAQWETEWSNFLDDITESSITFEESQQEAFNTWFETIKGQLSEDAAGNLQNQIYDLYDKNEFFNTLIVTQTEYEESLSTKLDDYIQTTLSRAKQKGDQVRVICEALYKNEIWLCTRLEGEVLSWIYFAPGKMIDPPPYINYTMLATGWSDNLFSFESLYPSATYDLEVSPSDQCTIDQLDIWNGAKIVGSATTNVLKALSEAPTMDIPVILKVVKK